MTKMFTDDRLVTNIINDWRKNNRARDSVTVQGVAVISHGEHVGSGPGGAGPVGVVVKISHRFGVKPDAVVTQVR